MLCTALVFIACNAAFGYYLLAIVPILSAAYAPSVVSAIGSGILLLGAFQLLMFVTGWGAAPTGKFNQGVLALSVGLPVNVAWWTMEQPSFLVPLVSTIGHFRAGGGFHPGVAVLCLFMAHYFQRAFIYPWLSRGRPYPLHTWASAMLFTASNGTLQANWLLHGPPSQLDASASYAPHAIAGYAVFAAGMFFNIQADAILRSLRKPGESAYKVPRGGLFEYVSGAHFVGEIIEWSGYALASGASYAPLVFAAFNWLGIGTRAIATHDWNVEKFGAEYPKGRKRLIPFVW
mmetsp:Transcript_3156/g.10539  ORF Transcript_3156/g.10539 Transcript_3156/m.10539 type:complete len:289 (+) Transcript_3156:208-1074(+)